MITRYIKTLVVVILVAGAGYVFLIMMQSSQQEKIFNQTIQYHYASIQYMDDIHKEISEIRHELIFYNYKSKGKLSLSSADDFSDILKQQVYLVNSNLKKLLSIQNQYQRPEFSNALRQLEDKLQVLLSIRSLHEFVVTHNQDEVVIRLNSAILKLEQMRRLHTIANTKLFALHEERNDFNRNFLIIISIGLLAFILFITRKTLSLVSLVLNSQKQAEDDLYNLNQELEHRVERRTRELEQANTQLTDALSTLQHAQNELVRSEKLASLGSLVSGVAHEMSTPLGNSLMVSSTFADNVKKLKKDIETGNLSEKSLALFIARSDKATNLLNRSLFRASELINHFKQVAVDQTSAQRREFDLVSTINEVLETLLPRFKKSPHQLNFESSLGINMDSYPGPIGQVITNLILNALLHGLDGVKAGQITLQVSEILHDACRIEVIDNGQGISPEAVKHIFDPFFTTKLGQGGSGLGLHIVYTIVTRILGGDIKVKSKPGKGTTFIVDIPLVAPKEEQSDRSMYDTSLRSVN